MNEDRYKYIIILSIWALHQFENSLLYLFIYLFFFLNLLIFLKRKNGLCTCILMSGTFNGEGFILFTALIHFPLDTHRLTYKYREKLSATLLSQLLLLDKVFFSFHFFFISRRSHGLFHSPTTYFYSGTTLPCRWSSMAAGLLMCVAGIFFLILIFYFILKRASSSNCLCCYNQRYCYFCQLRVSITTTVQLLM